MAKKNKSKKSEILFDRDALVVEDGYLVIRPEIRVGPFCHYGFMECFNALLRDHLVKALSEVSARYFFNDAFDFLPPSGEDKNK